MVRRPQAYAEPKQIPKKGIGGLIDKTPLLR